MREKALRQGSLGLVILLGIGVFGGIILWLKGFRLGENGFTFAIKFPDASGLDVGSTVRFRGVVVGKVQSLAIANDGAIVTVAISNPNIIIPRVSSLNEPIVETSQSGFISSTVIDILPPDDFKPDTNLNPISNCNSSIMICNGDGIDSKDKIVTGRVGVSFTRLLRQTSKTLDQVNKSQLIDTLSSTLKSTTEAAQSIKKLSDRVTTVVSGVDKQLVQFGDTAGELSRAAASVGKTASTAENFLTFNREKLAQTLDSLGNTSKEAQALLVSAKPLLANGEFVANLKKLSENAAITSENLRQLSKDANNPETLAALRATLDAARATFANAQKISTDLDELTGDPKFRSNIKTLINGLTGLISSGAGLNIPAIVPANTDPTTIAKAKSAEIHKAIPKEARSPEKPVEVKAKNDSSSANVER